MDIEFTLEDALACPGCNTKIYLFALDDANAVAGQEDKYCVYCDDCGWRGPSKKTISAAVKAWNNRPGCL